MNGFHGSDSEESAAREIALWFKPAEIMGEFESVSEPWLYEKPAPKQTVQSVVPNKQPATAATPKEGVVDQSGSSSSRGKIAAGLALVGMVVAAGAYMVMKQKK